MLVEELPMNLHPPIKRMSNLKMLQIMDMMKVRMRYIKDIKNHTYFFTPPDYNTELGRKFIRKLKKPPMINKQILADLHQLMKNIPEAEFNALTLNKACSQYLYEKSKTEGAAFKNEDIFFLFRYAMTGNPVGAPIGEISEVIGKSEVLSRLVDAQAVFLEYKKEVQYS